MTKRIEILHEKSGVRAVAEVQEQDAPKTSKAMWDALKSPIRGVGRHASWSGAEFGIPVPPTHRVFDPLAIPMENATAYPIPGDILWAFYPAHSRIEIKEDVWGIAIVYGRNTRFYSQIGILPKNLWACITEGLKEFARECEKMQTDRGKKWFTIRRYEPS